MRRTPITVLSVATAVATLGVGGCSRDLSTPAGDSSTTGPRPSAVAPPAEGPLPAPRDLGAVVTRLADPAVPGADKLSLVQGTAPADAAALDRFAAALRDTGLMPVTVGATGIQWSDNHPGDVLAIVKITGPATGPNSANPGELSFPIEFRHDGSGWQLTRETATMLLAFGNAHDARTAATAPPPATTPPP